MTFSILSRDPETGAIAGAAATGSLCVGGWVLRGDLAGGMSASQGAAPSTFWGQDVLKEMAAGFTAEIAVQTITARDKGRSFRQLSALDLQGGSGVFTGDDNQDWKGAIQFPDGVAAGNMLANAGVLSAMADEYISARGPLGEKMLAALVAGEQAGGDFRGLMSAALLVLQPDRAPITLRIDYAENPINALQDLHRRATSGDYADWARQVPSPREPFRTLD